MTTDITTLAARFAAALVEKLPTVKTLTPAPADGPTASPAPAITTSFVGAETYDIALHVSDDSAFAGASDGDTISIDDIVYGALDVAAATLGDGVLGQTRIDGASDLFGDASAGVVELRDGDAVIAVLALRTRIAATTGGAYQPSKLGRINNVEMNLTVEIGRTRMPVRDILDLEPGAVVELDRSAGSPADILLNGRLIAYGEVVVVDQDYAVRVTQILDAQDAAV